MNKDYTMIENDNDKSKNSKNGKEDIKHYDSKNIKHDPSAESSRAVFGLRLPNSEEEF